MTSIDASTNFRTAIEGLTQTLSSSDATAFQSTTIEDVWKAAKDLQEALRQRKTLRTVQRLEPFLKAIQTYSNIIEVVCNGKPYIPWLWAPIKLMLQIAADHTNAFDTLIDAYKQIAEVMPKFRQLYNVFGNAENFQIMLSLVYADILEFHHVAYRLFRRRSWYIFFDSLQIVFRLRFNGILKKIARHQELAMRQVTVVELLEARELTMKSDQDLQRQEKSIRDYWLHDTISWLKVTGIREDGFFVLGEMQLEGTCEWIFQNQLFRSWKDDPHGEPILWVKGDPGAGKTILSTYIIHKMQEQGGFTTAYHICNTYTLDKSFQSIFRSFTAQLLSSNPDLAPYVLENYVNKGVEPSVPKLKRLLHALLQTIPPVRFIIDGLDEYPELEQEIILAELERFTKESNSQCRVLFSNRENKKIARTLAGKPTISLRHHQLDFWKDNASNAYPFDSLCGNDDDQELNPAERQFLDINYKAPFTDSGYASLPNPSHPSHIPFPFDEPQLPTDADGSSAIRNASREDAATDYSVTSTVAPVRAQAYIAELCSGIHSKIGQSFGHKNLSSLHQALPILIKAFAIQIGYNSSAQVDRDIMYFIHKHHKEIIVQLEATFYDQNDDDDNSPSNCRSTPDGMSLSDKMTMWETKAVDDDPNIECCELYQGVGDDAYQDEIVDEMNLLSYRNAVFNSVAYDWLLASLKKESSLQWSATKSCNIAERIRMKIIDKLPAGTISKRRAPNVCEVNFDLRWGTERGQISGENFAHLDPPRHSLTKFIAVSGSIEEAQALTIKDYLNQTWPGSGLRLLDVIQKAIDHHENRFSVRFPDNTQLEASINGFVMRLTATGPAHFIAECGEQLAWLRAALLESTGRSTVYCTPLITNYRVDPVATSISGRLKYKGHCSIGLNISQEESSGEVLPRQEALLGITVMILGFPIARRPESFKGLELSFHRVLTLSKATGTTTVNGRVLLQGPELVLQLIDHSDNVFLWHPFRCPNDVCSNYIDRRTQTADGAPTGPFEISVLESGRHILENCVDFSIHASDEDDSSRTLKASSLPTSTNARLYISSGTNYAEIEKDDAPRPATSYLDYSEAAPAALATPRVTPSIQGDDGLRGFRTDGQGGHSLSSNQNVLKVHSHSSATTESTDETLDSDMLSVSDSSEQIELLDRNEPAYSLLGTLLQRLLSEFPNASQCQSIPSGGEEGFITPTPAARSSASSGKSNRPGKRSREGKDDEDDFGEDGFRKPPRKKGKLGKALLRPLACPYLKFDPIKYRTCCAKRLGRIGDVKQHLTRQHTPEWYCQRCLEIFKFEQNLDEHMNINACPRKDKAILDGLSSQQGKQLSKKSDSSLDEEGQWFAIWEIAFPKPSSRVFGDQKVIESDAEWSRSEVTAEQRSAYLQRAISLGIDSLFERYLRSSVASEAESSSEHNANNMAPAPTPVGSIADSGVALGSQFSSSEIMQPEGSSAQSSSIERSNYQSGWNDHPVHGNLMAQGIAVEQLPSQRGNRLNTDSADVSFEFPQMDNFQSFVDPLEGPFQFPQLSGLELMTFDQPQDFEGD